MAQITSGYEGSKTLKTTTSAAPSEGYELMRALTHDRKSDYEGRRANRSKETPKKATASRGGSSVGPRPAPGVMEFDQRPTKREQEFRNAQIRGEILRLQAQSGQAPVRMVTGAGIIPGYTLDPLAMNYYQRQAYLPTSAQGYPSGAAGAETNITPIGPREGWGWGG